MDPHEPAPAAVINFPDFRDAKRIAVDIETFDPNLKSTGPSVRTGGYIVGVAVAIEDGPSTYLPVAHAGGGNLDKEHVFNYLRDNARDFKGVVTGANLQYDFDYLAEQDITFWNAQWRDVQVADPLIYEMHDSYSLQAISQRFGFPGKEYTELERAAAEYGLKSMGAEMWKLPADRVAKYAIGDVELPLKILRLQEQIISDQDLWKIFDLECRVQQVLLKMRRRGVRIDFDKLEQIERWSEQEEAKALNEIKRQTGVNIAVGDVWKAGAIAPAIEQIGIKVPLTEKTKKPSIDKDFLGGIDHKVAELLNWARRVNKVRTTFAASMHTYQVNGRIHTTFNQLRKQRDDGDRLGGAAYGRLSSQDPNFQQQPARDPDIGPLWRQIFLPDEGGTWACLDYSQQEPRWLMHLAETFALHPNTRWEDHIKEKAIAAAEAYRQDPNTDFHQMNADMCGIERKPAKEIGLGLLYGMGGGKLCMKLGLPVTWLIKYNGRWVGPDKNPEKYQRLVAEGYVPRDFAGPEGKKLLNKFDEGAPFIKLLTEKCKVRGNQVGHIITIGGRRCRFPVDSRGRYDWTHKGLNRWIQGSSADQTKQAMINADEAGIAIQLQVHDELNYTERDPKETQALAEIMRDAIPCRVPMVVDVETGPSWGEVS